MKVTLFFLLFLLFPCLFSSAQSERKTADEKATIKTDEMVKTYSLNKTQKEKINSLNKEYYKNLLAVNIKYKSEADVLEYERKELLKSYDEDVLEIFTAKQDEKYRKEIANRSNKTVKKKK